MLSVTRSPWRLIDSGPLDGPSNMAVDEALLNSFASGQSEPIVRFYGWSPPAFSLGRFQDVSQVLHVDRCVAAGIPVVRRITGGGCLYHAEEVTYSIICRPEHLAGAGGVKESFRVMCGFLLSTYRKLGLASDFAVDAAVRPDRLGERTLLCCAGTEEYDILISGRKLGGNAQRRTRGLIFQHGSLPLRPGMVDILPLLRCPESAVRARCTTLAEEGVTVTPDSLKRMLVAAFAENLRIDFRPATLTAREQEAVTMLQDSKYLASRWNLTGEQP